MLCMGTIIAYVAIPAFAQESKTDVINVIVIGNSSEILKLEKSMLPTGYGWVTKNSQDIPLEFSNKADDPNALFILEDGYTDVPYIIEWAKKNGKTNIYFFYTPPVEYPEGERPPHTTLGDVWGCATNFASYLLSPLNSIDLNEMSNDIFNFIIPPAHAYNCQPSSCTTGSTAPATQCYGNRYCQDDNPNDGQCIEVRYCLMYPSKSCHASCMHHHLHNNTIIYNDTPNSNMMSLPNCMKFYNGANSHMQPVRLTMKVWKNTSDLIPQTICGGDVCGCAPESPSPTQCDYPDCNVPLPSGTLTIYDKTIHIAEPCERNKWGVARHEMLHQYGYGHCHMEKDLRKTSRCVDGTKGGQCNSPSDQNNPPRTTGFSDNNINYKHAHPEVESGGHVYRKVIYQCD